MWEIPTLVLPPALVRCLGVSYVYTDIQYIYIYVYLYIYSYECLQIVLNSV